MNLRRIVIIGLIVALVSAGFAFANGTKEAPKGNLKVALVVKNLGNSFFEAVRDGGSGSREGAGRGGPDLPGTEHAHCRRADRDHQLA